MSGIYIYKLIYIYYSKQNEINVEIKNNLYISSITCFILLEKVINNVLFIG